jgi:hypothetical protein
LKDVAVGIVERQDRAGVVEERVRIPRLRREAELVGDVLDAVAVVVDLEFVEDVIAEAIEVGTALWILERDPRRNERHRVGVIGTDERVHVGRICLGIAADERRFTVARGVGRHHLVADQRHDQRGKHQTLSHEDTSCGGKPWKPVRRGYYVPVGKLDFLK